MKNSDKHDGWLQQVEGWVARTTLMLVAVVVVCVSSVTPGQAQTFSVLHRFGAGGICFPSDGCTPQAGPILDAEGNLYGTTSAGGKYIDGTMYKIDPTGHYSTLTNFYGYGPGAAPIQDAAGDFYGTTYWDAHHEAFIYGTVWKVGKKGGNNVTTLFDFTNHYKEDGAFPFWETLAISSKGELYGVTAGTGVFGQCTPPLCGTLYKLSDKSPGKLTLLHVFGKGKDGITPGQGPLLDAGGNLYGSTACGGKDGLGTIFEFTNAGEYKVLYNFKGGKGVCGQAGQVGGPWASGTLVLDSQGNLYGAAWSDGKFGLGMVFKLSPSGQLTDLHDFAGKTDGANPWGGVVRDAKGNLYGVTIYSQANSGGNGSVFEIDTAGHFKVLYAFTGGSDGSGPVGLTIDETGSTLYGATSAGGDPKEKSGVVFKLVL